MPDHQHRAVEQQHYPRPANRLAPLFRVRLVQRDDPLLGAHPDRLGVADRVRPHRQSERRGHGVAQDRPQPAAHRPAGDVDGQQLQHVQPAQRRRLRQHHLAVAVRVQRVAVVVGVAQRVVVVVEPRQRRKDAQEDAVEPLGLEHGAVVQLVARRAEKAAEGAVQVERQREADPRLLQEQVVRNRRGGGEQGQVAPRLQPPLQVAALHQAAQRPRLDRAAIPAHALGAGNLVQRRTDNRHGSQG